MPRFFRFQCVVKLINLREFEGRNLSSPWSTYLKKNNYSVDYDSRSRMSQ